MGDTRETLKDGIVTNHTARPEQKERTHGGKG